ncbi:MAG: hypothetical protein LBE92_20705 [Chryseobacterium sp.]|jgi:hypothetical protein|uniref:hypothetical protein n=1 Tax=Chryseobacterium sp. TaxID=1871047 RepID=UPI0028294323|nr:hypothetical protein [Chryseobacterium sp.]MDR2238557.1 hypothetical protein [Chryseobacterium sp.]
MNNSRLILAAALMLFSAATVTAQKKKPTAPSKKGPMEMPKDAEVQIMGGGDKAVSDFYKINDRITFKYDANYKNADIYITEDGTQKLMYKAKVDDTGVDTQLKARINHYKVYSLDRKTLLFTYESEASATSLIKMIAHSPAKTSTILDFSQAFEPDSYTMGKTETFQKFPVFLYYSIFDAPKK